MNSFFNFEIIYIFIIYYNIVIWNNEIIQNIAYANYDDFKHDNLKFSQIFIHYFEDYLMTKLTLR
jgi:hypothetical protein